MHQILYVGTLPADVTIEDGYREEFYLGGMEIKVGERTVMCVSKHTPLGLALFGKGVGEQVKPNKHFSCCIVGIQ